MAVKGKVPQALSIDPAVEAVMGKATNDPVYGGLKQVKAARNQTKAQRRKAAADSKRNRTMFDLDAELEQVLDWLAEKNGTSRSQVAGYLMVRGLAAVEDSTLQDLPRHASRAIRFEYLLDMPEIPEGVKNAIKRQRTTQP